MHIINILINNTISWIKDNEWIFWVFGAIAILIGWLTPIKSNRSKKREFNQRVYNDLLQSDFHLLFEFDEPQGFTREQLDTGGYDLTEIAKFCFRVIDFKAKGNYFKGICVRNRFSRLYKIAKKTYSYTDGPDYILSVAVDPYRTHMDIYRSNPKQFEKLKLVFKKFYLSVFDHL